MKLLKALTKGIKIYFTHYSDVVNEIEKRDLELAQQRKQYEGSVLQSTRIRYQELIDIHRELFPSLISILVSMLALVISIISLFFSILPHK